MSEDEKIFDKLLTKTFKRETGYVVVIILSDGSEKRIPYIESQRPEAEAFAAMLNRHGVKAWLARP